MTRFLFVSDPFLVGALVGDQQGVAKLSAGQLFQLFADRTSGTAITDVTPPDASAPVANNAGWFTADGTGQPPDFRGPDGVVVLWVDGGAGHRYPIFAVDLLTDLLKAAIGWLASGIVGGGSSGTGAKIDDTATSDQTTWSSSYISSGITGLLTRADFREAVEDRVGALIAAAGGTYDDTAGTIALPSGATNDQTSTSTTVALSAAATKAIVTALLTRSDFIEAVQDQIGTLVAGAGGTYNDPAGTITLPSSPGGTATGMVSYASSQTLSATQRAQARSNTGSLADGPARFHVADYGAVGDGVTDDRPAFATTTAAAVAYIQANSADAIVDFTGMGVCVFASGVSKTAASVLNAAGSGPTIDTTATDYSSLGVPIPSGLPGRLTFAGQGTKIKLTTSCVCAFWPDKTRDYQVWQNLTFDQVTVDDNSIISTTKTRGHVIWGNMPAWGVKMRYTSLQDVEAFHCRVLNANTDFSATVGAGQTTRIAFMWSGDHNGPSEATQTFTRRIRTRGGYQQGGDGLYNFFSTVADRYRAGGAVLGGVNHYYDDLDIGDGWVHINSQPQTQQRYQTSIYLCGSGKGDRYSIGDGSSENIGDDVIEVGGMLRGTITAPRCKNPFFNLILFRHTGVVDGQKQQITVRRSRTDVTTALSGTTGAFAAPMAWISDDWYLTVTLGGTVTGGTFTLTIPLSSGSVTTAPIAYNATPAQVAAAVDAVVTAVNTSGPGGGLTAYAGGAVNATTPTTFVIVKQSLAANGRVTANGAALTGTNPTVTVGLASQGTGFGRFRFEDDIFAADGLTSSKQGRTDLFTKGPGLGVPILGLELIRPRVELTNYTYDGATANYELFMLVHANSLYANWPLALRVEDPKIRANGCNLAGGAGTGFMFMVGVEGYSTVAVVEGLETDFSGSTGGTWGQVIVAKNQGSQIRAFVAGLKPKGQPTLASYAGLRVGAEGSLSVASLRSSDFTLFGNPANGLILPSSGTYADANIVRTRAQGNSPDVVPVPLARTASFTVGQADSGAPPIRVDSTAAVTITVPQLVAGSNVTFVRMNTGTVTLAAGSGVTLVGPSGSTLAARAQGSSISLTWLSATQVLVEGDLG